MQNFFLPLCIVQKVFSIQKLEQVRKVPPKGDNLLMLLNKYEKKARKLSPLSTSVKGNNFTNIMKIAVQQ